VRDRQQRAHGVQVMARGGEVPPGGREREAGCTDVLSPELGCRALQISLAAPRGKGRLRRPVRRIGDACQHDEHNREHDPESAAARAPTPPPRRGSARCLALLSPSPATECDVTEKAITRAAVGGRARRWDAVRAH
jgi:hypothetical protein